MRSLLTKGIDNLDLVAPLHINPAVSAPLAAVEGLIGNPEFHVQIAVLEFLEGFCTPEKMPLLGHLAVLPALGIAAIKENDRSLFRFLAKRLALSVDSLERTQGLAAGARNDKRPTLDDSLHLLVLRRDDAILGCEFIGSGAFVGRGVKTVSRQPSRETVGVKLSGSAGDELHTVLLIISPQLAAVLTLDRVVSVHLFRIGVAALLVGRVENAEKAGLDEQERKDRKLGIGHSENLQGC